MSASNIGETVLNVLFPKRCPWCDRVIGFETFCTCDAKREALRLPHDALDGKFEGGRMYFSGVWACYTYEEPIRSSIHSFKFEGQKELAGLFAQDMAKLYTQKGMAVKYSVIIPVPSSEDRLKERGYNQSALLAKELAHSVGASYIEELLQKVRHTSPQTKLPRAQRLTNLKDAFVASGRVAGMRVLLVDDIVTSGSTLNECAKALRDAGASECAALCFAASMGQGDTPKN